jgi:hypothetical protein
LLRRYPQEFRCGTGMTVEEYLHALSVHVDRCRAFLESCEYSHATVETDTPSERS